MGLSLTAGCGDDPARSASDAGGLDVLFSDLGAMPDVGGTTDSAADTTDPTVADTLTSDTAEDTRVTPDTMVSEDTTVADTVAEDTSVADTVADTTAADTTIADTTVEDTTIADTSVAETVADTAVTDTSVAPDASGYDMRVCTTNMAPSGATCATAYVIGRPNANSGFGHQGSTIGAGNDSDFPQPVCGDSGNDRFYQIYLEVGEQLTVNANPDVTYDLTYGLYRGLACETPITCVDNDVNQTTPDTMLYQAVEPGWHTIVVDGRNSNGNYSLVVTLDCQQDDCGCK